MFLLSVETWLYAGAGEKYMAKNMIYKDLIGVES